MPAIQSKLRRYAPDPLFHYKSVNTPEKMGYLERMLLCDELFFSSPASFNDPFDCKVWPSFECTSEEKRAYIERVGRLVHSSIESEIARTQISRALADPDFFNAAYRQFQQQSIPTLGVFCLSERSTDILMWSHYADSHRGVCLIVGGSLIFPDLAVEAVCYPENNRYPDVNFFTNSDEEMINAVLLTKATHWQIRA